MAYLVCPYETDSINSLLLFSHSSNSFASTALNRDNTPRSNSFCIETCRSYKLTDMKSFSRFENTARRCFLTFSIAESERKVVFRIKFCFINKHTRTLCFSSYENVCSHLFLLCSVFSLSLIVLLLFWRG